MLKHGLQEIEGIRILVPIKKPDRPDPERLETRYEQFKAVA